jgi:hypothetical protein
MKTKAEIRAKTGSANDDTSGDKFIADQAKITGELERAKLSRLGNFFATVDYYQATIVTGRTFTAAATKEVEALVMSKP